MNTSNSSAPGPSTPGGELQQISPDAWPTAEGGQTEKPISLAATPRPQPGSISSAAEQLRDNWERIKGNLKRKFAELTDDDLNNAEKQEAALIDCVQQKTGRSRTEIKDALNLHTQSLDQPDGTVKS